MEMLCPYKYMFGEPKKGVHSYRIFNLAIVDIVCTIVVAYGISYWFNQNFIKVLIALFVLGIVFHRLFCVRTTVDIWLFPEKKT
jgi:hypothetical protein